MKLNELTISSAARGLLEKKFSARDLVAACLSEISARDDEIGAYLLVDSEGAGRAAAESDQRLASGRPRSRLEGIPIAIKDNILVLGLRCSAGSKMLAEYTASYDATVITRLKQAGAVIIGKTNLDEFAMGSSTETSAFKITKNPHDLTRVPGGSSGGSAAAVSAHLALGALGTDTGGSIRLPASFTGVVGLKPTYGRVSRSGAIALASSLDQIGPIGKCVADAAALLEAIEGKDPFDATSVELEETTVPELLSAEIKGKRIGLPKEYFIEGMDPEVERVVRAAIQKYEEWGAEIVPITLPHTSSCLECYYIIMPAEVSSNLARYDGIRYGTRAIAETLADIYEQTRGALFGAEQKRRIMVGAYVLSSGYYDAYYRKAQCVRTLLKRDFETAFNSVDAIAAPTAPSIAFKLGEKINDPINMYLSDIYTVSANLAGIPAISFPCGKAHGLPVGLQFMARAFGEATLLTLANGYERRVDWRQFS